MQKQNKLNSLLTKTIITISILTLLSFSSCNTTDPPPPTKSPRDYTWTVDTLDLPITFQISMSSIWGSSENDVYTCGHVSGSLGDLWHFNGKRWEVLDYSKEWEGRGFLQTVHGTSYDNVWVVGSKYKLNSNYQNIDVPFIMQFDGVSWKEHEIDTENRIEGLLVLSKTDVWACGVGGLVYHYNGNRWDIDTLVNPVNKDFNFQLRRIVGDENEKYILSTNSNNSTGEYHYHIFKQVNNKWELLDTENNENYGYEFGVTNLYYTSTSELYTVGPELYKRTDSWQYLFVDGNTWLWSIFDNGKNNLITAGSGRAFHYNGSDWKEINELTDEESLYKGVWMNNKNIFVIGSKSINERGRTIIYRGK